MKKAALFIAAATFALSAPPALFAMDHDSMKMEHGGMMSMGKLAHEEVVDGVKEAFRVIDIKAKMRAMGMKETHHIMVMFTDAKSGRMMSGGEVKIKVVAPDKSEQVKELMGMEGGFGADFTMAKPGKYGIMCRFKLGDGRVRSTKFRYVVK